MVKLHEKQLEKIASDKIEVPYNGPYRTLLPRECWQSVHYCKHETNNNNYDLQWRAEGMTFTFAYLPEQLDELCLNCGKKHDWVKLADKK